MLPPRSEAAAAISPYSCVKSLRSSCTELYPQSACATSPTSAHTGPLSSEHGTFKTVTTRFRPWLSGKSVCGGPGLTKVLSKAVGTPIVTFLFVYDHLTPTRKIKHARALARNHPEGWKMERWRTWPRKRLSGGEVTS